MLALEVWGSDPARTIETCRAAEHLGVDAFYYGESPHGLNLECWSTLAALAGSTRSIRLGPVLAALVPGYRSLALLAKQAATVASIADGRLDFRTGAGAAASHARAWWRPVGVDYRGYDERLAALDRALPVLRAYWSGKEVSFVTGHPCELGFRCPTIPVTVAATGSRATRVAARHADVWETSFATPREYRARTAGFPHDPERPKPTGSLEVDAFVGTTRRRADAVIDLVRRERELPPLALDEVLRRAVVGTPEEAATRLEELAGAGVERFVVALHDPHDRDALEAIVTAARSAGTIGRRGRR